MPSEDDLFFAKVVAKAHQEQKQFFSGKSFFTSNLIDLCKYLDFREDKIIPRFFSYEVFFLSYFLCDKKKPYIFGKSCSPRKVSKHKIIFAEDLRDLCTKKNN